MRQYGLEPHQSSIFSKLFVRITTTGRVYNQTMETEVSKVDSKSVGKRTFVQRIFQVEYFLIVAMAVFIVLAILSRNIPYFQFDLTITRAIQRIDFPVFNVLMLQLTNLGNTGVASLVTLMVVGALMVLKKRTAALITVISTLGLSGIGNVIKIIVARPRPASSLINQLGTFVKPDSFPSGHVLQFMGLYGFLFVFIFTVLKKSTLRTVVLIILLFLLVGIGISRIDVGAHWFSDVLGSYLLGFIWLYFMTYLYNKYEKKSPKK